jgi:hypothetical protein
MDQQGLLFDPGANFHPEVHLGKFGRHGCHEIPRLQERLLRNFFDDLKNVFPSVNKKPTNSGLIKRVMGFEPTSGSLGSYCLTTWRHPR